MVTARKVFKADSYYMEYRGLHADPKPVNVKEGDIFKELDTDSVYQFKGGKWVFSPGGAGGEGLSDGIDIIGTDKELKDLSGIAVGFDLPDIPGEPDVTVSKTFTLGENIIFSEDMPFDFGVDFDDLSIYSYQDQTAFFPKPLQINLAFDTGEISAFSAAGAYYYKYDDGGNTYYEVEFIVRTSDFACRYIPRQESQGEEYHGLEINYSSSPSGATQLTVTLTQKGAPAVTGRASEIAAKYIESPEVEKGLKFNALKEVGVGYVKEGDKITVVNDGTGDTTTIQNLSMRKVSDVFPFDISGETEESHGDTFIKLDMPITVELSNPAIAQEVGNSIPYIASYPVSATGGVAVYVGVASPEDLEAPFFFYAENDVELPTGTLLKGLWVIDMTAPVKVAITSLTQEDPDTIHKIDAKYLDIPPVVDGEGTTDLKNFSKIAAGGVKGFEFTYDASASYETVATPESSIIKVAEFEDVDITNEDDILKNPIRYRYSLKMEGSSPQELTGVFDVVSPASQGIVQIKDSTAGSGVKGLFYLMALENGTSISGISLTRGVWGLLKTEGNPQIIPLNFAQELIVKIPSKYLDVTGGDGEFILAPGKAGIVLLSHTANYESLLSKVQNGSPLDINVYFENSSGVIEDGWVQLSVTGVTPPPSSNASFIFRVGDPNNVMSSHDKDFPGYIELASDGIAVWVSDPVLENVHIEFNVTGSGAYSLSTYTSYTALKRAVDAGNYPTVKAYINANKENIN